MSAKSASAKAATSDSAPPRLARGPVAVGTLSARAARPALGKRGFAAAEILTHWPSIVGTDLAAFACPLELRFPKGRNAGATLHLRVASGAAATLLHLKAPAILARVNGFLGYEAVTQVQAAQGPLPPRGRTPETAVPVDPPATLEDALGRLRAAVEQRARTKR